MQFINQISRKLKKNSKKVMKSKFQAKTQIILTLSSNILHPLDIDKVLEISKMVVQSKHPIESKNRNNFLHYS